MYFKYSENAGFLQFALIIILSLLLFNTLIAVKINGYENSQSLKLIIISLSGFVFITSSI